MAKQTAKGKKAPSKLDKTAENAAKTTESPPSEPRIDKIPPEVHAQKATPSEKTVEATKPAPEQQVAEPKPEKPSPPPSPAPAPVPKQSGGFFPMLLGGLVAGAIGFFIGTQTDLRNDTTIEDRLTTQADQIAALQDQVSNLPVVDLSGIETAQATLSTDLEEGLGVLDERLAALETLPTGDGTMSDRAIASFEAELDALRSELATMSDVAATQLGEARAEAAAIEENAEAAARAAAGRAALARIQTSLDDGAPIGAALGDLEEALQRPAPNELLAAQEGVPTLNALQQAFPEAATDALAAARGAGVAGEETTGFGAFLRNQFDVRSTTPQEGNSTDAILSRAEAAINAGRLSDALAEIAALPEEARAAMSDWLAMAETRAAAIDAVSILSTSLNDS